MMNPADASVEAHVLLDAEITRQNAMWGNASQRSDANEGELMRAAMAQLDALYGRQQDGGMISSEPPGIYPKNWSGFRDYGSDVANLVVACAFIFQEIKRKITNGEDTMRTSRDHSLQPYVGYNPHDPA